jgi:hypothetical protein
MGHMREKILDHLRALEEERNIRILMAVESGSRAWGFPSPDSDYDVRIVYMKNLDWYLSIGEKKDTINYFHGKLLDINGWDIRKTLSLLRKSNATPFEWAQSPIVYREEPGFRAELLDLARRFFQPYHALNHYRGIAANSYTKGLSGDQIKLKKLFYVIRPIFAINWILERMSAPPMDIFSLMEAVKEEGIKDQVLKLIKLKESAEEDFVYKIDPMIRSFIEEQFKKLEEMKFPTKKEEPKVDELNSFFRDLLKRYGS